MNVVAICVCVAAVFLLSGVIYSFLTPNSHPRFSFVFVAFFVGVGALGLKIMFDSRLARNPWVSLFLGFLLVLVSSFALDLLFVTGFGR